MTRAPIRWSKATEELEYRCEECSLRGNAAWWPLSPEFWDYRRAWTRCRACWKEYDRERNRRLRQDEEYRAVEREYARTYYSSMSLPERRAKRAKFREYHRDWMRAYRARKKAGEDAGEGKAA